MARDFTRSPFPGMDPYLELYWGDVHHRLCTYGCDLLQQMLPQGLISRIDERTVVEVGIESQRTIIPDIRVVDFGNFSGSAAASTMTIDEPMIVDNDLEITEGFIQVIDLRDNSRIVTAIEFASPVNKVSSVGREKYQRKRRELLSAGVSVVEIDLIRAGTWNLFAPQIEVEARRQHGVYHACLTRGWHPAQSGVYSISLQKRLPTIRIPLRETDKDAMLDLQALINQVYENGSYGYTLNYAKSLNPPLTEADRNWASELLQTGS